MKKIIIIISTVLFCFSILAKENQEKELDFNVYPEMTIEKLSYKIGIPQKKLLLFLGYESTNINKMSPEEIGLTKKEYKNVQDKYDKYGSFSHVTLADLNLNQDKIISAKESFKKEEYVYYLGIIVVGIAVVFTSLIIILLIVSQLKNFEKKPKKKSKAAVEKNSTKTVATGSLGEEVITAVIAALFLYEKDIEEKTKFVDWKKTEASTWKVMNTVNMPNQVHNTLKRR